MNFSFLKNKLFLAVIAVVIIIAALGAAFSLARKNKSMPVVEDASKAINSRFTASRQKKREFAPLTTQDKIYDAWRKGEISASEQAVLDILSSFKPEEVPAQYQGKPETVGRSDLNWAMGWAIKNWEELKPKDKAAVKPYIVSPDDQESFLNNDKTGRLPAVFAPAVRAAENWQKIYFDINEGAVIRDSIGRIFYHSGEEQAAQRVKTAALKAWPMYLNLLGKSFDKPVKFYLTDVGNDYGVSVWKESPGHSAFCEIRLNNKQDMMNNLETTVAHELFHCFQFNFDPIYKNYGSNKDIDWLMEATATWSENFVYPKVNSEHEYLPDFFKNLYSDLITTAGTHEYGSYLWFFFLSQRLGRDGHVKTVLEKAVNGKVKEAVRASVQNYEDEFAEFGAWNWNQNPSERYQDPPGFPSLKPEGSSLINVNMLEFNENLESIAIDGPGGMDYQHYYFEDNPGGDVGKIKKVVFDFNGKNQNKNFQRIAFVKIGDVWERREWDDVEKAEFCRRDNDGRIQEAILSWANADLKNISQALFNVNIKDDCERKLSGYLRIEERTGFANKQIKNSLRIEETVEYDAEKEAFVVTSRKADCNNSDISEAIYPYVNKKIKSTITEIGSINEKYDLDENNDIRFKLNGDGKSGYILTDLHPKNPNWVKVESTFTGSSPETEYSSCSGEWNDRYDLKPDEIKKDRIKGHRTYPLPGGEIVVDFDYPLP